MCEKCVRKAKRLKPTLTFGQIKFYAHQLIKGNFIPLFEDKANNYAIEAHVHRIQQKKTAR